MVVRPIAVSGFCSDEAPDFACFPLGTFGTILSVARVLRLSGPGLLQRHAEGKNDFQKFPFTTNEARSEKGALLCAQFFAR
jgi:hypothetical protein